MLPSRSRLESWNPDSLTFTGKAIEERGRAVADSVATLSTNIATMPDTRAWSGAAHDAATGMFERASNQTKSFSAYTTAISEALAAGASTIGGARTALLDKADHIDVTGQLYVSEQWVVLITGAKMTLEDAAELERRAQAEQATINRLLLAVGAADDATADSLTAAAKPHGFEVPGASDDPFSTPTPGSQRPGDEVPNPSNPVGMMQQAVIRDTDMAQTVRDTKTETKYDPITGEEVSTTTTIYKQDGTKHVTTEYARTEWSDRSPATTETVYDKDGNIVSESNSVTFNEFARDDMANVKVTTVKLPDGTSTTLLQHPDGRKSATVHTPGRPVADVPLELFDNPLLTGAETAVSGLEAQARGGLPMISQEAAERVQIGAKYGGPAIGIVSSLWDVATAETGFQKCVATAEGVTSVAAGTLAGVATSGGTPLVSMSAALAAGFGGKALGNWIGNTFCPR